MKKGDTIYFTRMLSGSDGCDVYDCRVRTVAESWFTIIDKRSKQVFLLDMSDIGKRALSNRNEAVSRAQELEEKILRKN